MDKKISYTCEQCKKTMIEENKKTSIPQCCGRPMKKTTEARSCQGTVTAEHERFYDIDDPCDEGTAG